MKRVIIFTLLCVLTLGLCACGIKTTTYPNGQRKELSDQFTVIKMVSGGMLHSTCCYLYDNVTKIVYLYTYGGSHATMCPYYIIVDGAPTLAIYGVNYMEDK